MEQSSGRKRAKQLTLHDTPKKQKLDENENDLQRRAGVIIRMVLKNFMCHSLLEMKFVNNTTVLIGQNGSGKSAILTALIVGLGGKASLTNRGTSIKGFVKAGRNSATIEITLYNGGPMAYRPNLFGDYITVIRHFTASGSSSYKIKNNSGDIISTSCKEIQNITAWLSIQIDNPICVLNQDTSRNFLSSNDPKHKFTLFMKATRLEILAEDYKKVHANLGESSRLLDEKMEDIQKMREDMKKLKEKIDEHKSARNLKDEELALHNELLWAKVRDAEQIMQAQQETLDKISKKCETFRQNSNKKTEELDALKKSITQIEQQVAEVKNTIDIQNKPLSEAKKTLEKLKALYDTKQRDKLSLQNAIKSINQDIRVLEEEIVNSNENKNRVEEEKTQRGRHIGELEQKIKANDDILQTARNEVFQVKSDIARKEEDNKNLKQEIHEIDTEIRNHQDRLNSLKEETGNSLLIYGRNIPRIIQAIEQNKHRFQHSPRGPIGSYIKLKDRKWAVAAEGYLGNALLNSFIVDNKQDNQLLVQIFKKISPDRIPTIITSKFFDKIHNVSKNLVKAPSDCVSLFDILEIEDPVITNCIIDESSVEGILLIPSDDRAITLLSNRENVPRNCTMGVTIKGDRYYPDPNYKTYCSDYHHAQYLQVDTRDHLKQLEHRVLNLQKKKQAIINQYKQVKDEMTAQISKQNELESKIRRLVANRSEIRTTLDKIRSLPEPEVTDIHVLENELAEVRNTLNDKTANIEKINNELKELKAPLDKTEEHVRELKRGIENFEERIPPLQEQIREKQTMIREASTNKDFESRRIIEFESRLQDGMALLVLKQNDVQKHKTKAENLGTRPDNLRQVPDIVDKLNNVERTIKRIQASAENVEETFEYYKDLGEKFATASNLLKVLSESVNELKVAVKLRKKHYKVTESYFISYIKHSFQKILEFRQFKGSIKVDVESKKLELVVIPQQGSQGNVSTTNLSGGERSFSTVAFLYSLWQCMDFPFYFLDEFDVYMDKQNRTKVFDILLHHASTKPQLQFVFLTPQDISFLKKSVSILRLEDPKRLNG